MFREGAGGYVPPEARQPASREQLPPEQKKDLLRYIALTEKHNRAVGTEPMLTRAEMRELGGLMGKLGEEFIRKHVSAFEVNGPVIAGSVERKAA